MDFIIFSALPSSHSATPFADPGLTPLPAARKKFYQFHIQKPLPFLRLKRAAYPLQAPALPPQAQHLQRPPQRPPHSQPSLVHRPDHGARRAAV